MSAYTNAPYTRAQPHLNKMYETFQRPRRVICGVCATLADRSGVPTWIIRVVAVCLLVAHTLLTTVVYLCAAAWMRRPAAGTLRDFSCDTRGGPGAPPSAWDRDGLVNRFNRLDGRLSRMEREALDREAGLRRAFRDLDRG
jgi:phage shock protein PspC (stress-responsive transcriptional regulator)